MLDRSECNFCKQFGQILRRRFRDLELEVAGSPLLVMPISPNHTLELKRALPHLPHSYRQLRKIGRIVAFCFKINARCCNLQSTSMQNGATCKFIMGSTRLHRLRRCTRTHGLPALYPPAAMRVLVFLVFLLVFLPSILRLQEMLPPYSPFSLFSPALSPLPR